MRLAELPQLFIKPMSVPIRYLLRRPFTVIYPFERLDRRDAMAGKRGIGALDDESAWVRWRGRPVLDLEECTSCYMCADNCPDKCITMAKIGSREFPEINLERCMFCDICSEVCPRDCLWFSADYNLAEFDKRGLYYDTRRMTGRSLLDIATAVSPQERRKKATTKAPAVPSGASRGDASAAKPAAPAAPAPTS